MCSNAGSCVCPVEPENDTARGRDSRVCSCCHLYIPCLEGTASLEWEPRHPHRNNVRDIRSWSVIWHRERFRVRLKLMGEIRRRGLARRQARRPIIIRLPLPARNKVLAKHLHPLILLKALRVNGRVGRWGVLETKPNGSGRASGTYPAYGGHITGPTTAEHDGFSGRGGTGSAGPRSGWDIRQRRGADILGAKTAYVRGTADRIWGSHRGSPKRTRAPATAGCANCSRWREAGADDIDGSTWAGHCGMMVG